MDITLMSNDQRRALERDLLSKATKRQREDGLRRHTGNGPVPASLAQQRLWFFHKLRPGEGLYQSWACFQVAGEVDVVLLGRAFDAVVRRHEILRTRIISGENGEPVQVVDDPAPLGLTVLRADGDPQELVSEIIRRPFDLERQWPFAARLIRVDDTEHLLVLAWHHIVFDGLSWSIFCRDLSAAYEDVDLPELPVQYADFAVWQRRQQGSAKWDDQIRYWQQQLAGIPQVIDLPLDRPRPRQRTHNGAMVQVEIPVELAEALRGLGASVGSTPFMTLMTAFQIVLHRYSGDDTVVVGTPVAGRTNPKLDELIGFFVNTLAVRSDFDDAPTFSALLARTKENLLQGMDNQDVPFDVIAHALGIEPQLSYNPVFQAMFQLNSEGPEEFTLPGMDCQRMWPEWGSCDFDLHLYLTETEAGAIRGWLAYSTDVFDEAAAVRVSEHYVTLLWSLGDNPDVSVRSVSFLPDAERAMILRSWSGIGEEAVPERYFHEYVDGQALIRPDATAVEFGGTTLSYAELARRSDQFANYLRARGVGPETVIGMLLEPSAEVFVTVLGIHKAGAAFLSMDTRFPGQWIEFVLSDSAARLVVTTNQYVDLAKGVDKVCLDRDADEIDSAPDGPPGHRVDGSNLAYLIYTGGSTGRPKGVLVEHRNLANHLALGVESHRLTPVDRCLQFMSHSFDVWVEEMAATLSAGATLVVRGPDFDLAPASFVDRCGELRISNIHVPTSYWHELVDAGGAAGLAALQDVRLVSIGGEPAAADRVRRWQAEVGTSIQLRNGYGPSECTVTPGWIDLTEYEFSGAVPIGKPIRNCQMYVLDETGQPVGVGVVGELHIAGNGISRGYASRGDLTAKAFLPNEFSGESGSRLYRTGDRARYLPDGNLVMLGRYDDQIKLRGYRIEPHDVEVTLRQHPDVRDALVRVREDVHGDRRLVAYIVTDHSELSEQLREFLAEKLPSYMVPSAFVTLAAIPHTPSGKLDSGRLPEPVPSAPIVGPRAQPRNATERRLLALWGELLGVTDIDIGIDDDFFRHGGHSLLAVQLVGRIQREFGAVLPVSALFPQATVARLAELIDAGQQVLERTVVPVRLDPGGLDAVLVHPVGGDIVCYFPMAAAIDGPVRVFGVRSPSLGEREVTFPDLPAMAGSYLAQLRSDGVTMPAVFGGWSVGGLVALELARQDGRAVPVLAIDSKIEPLGHLDPNVVFTQRSLLSAFVGDVTSILGLDMSDVDCEDVAQRLTKLSAAFGDAGLADGATDVAGLTRRFAIFCENTRHAATYRPDPYPGRVVLVLARERLDANAVVEQWQRIALGGLDVHLVDGDHYSIMSRSEAQQIARAWPYS